MVKLRGQSRTPTSDGSSSSSPERPAYGDDSDDFTTIGGDERNISIADQLPNFRNMAVSSTSPTRAQPRKSGELTLRPNTTADPKLPPVYRLPPEILIHIFSKIISPTDLRNCLLVNRKWAACSVELLWHRPYVTKWSSFEKVVKAIQSQNPTFSYSRLIRRLNLTFLAKEISDGTLSSLSVCERLERLTLTNCKELTDSGLDNLIPNNPGILALDLSSLCQLTDRTLDSVASSCPRLQGLNIAGCHKITNASLISLSLRCKQLKRVSLCVRDGY